MKIPLSSPSSKSLLAEEALGGDVAEEVIFGEAEVTTGASSDLSQVASMAKQMVTTFGMSDVGPWARTR